MQCNGKSNTILAKCVPSFVGEYRSWRISRILQDFYTEYSSHDRIVMRTGPSAEDLCREVLLSYRLIFGLDSPSRKLFNRECAKELRLSSDFDPLSTVLCGESWNSLASKDIFEEIDADPPAPFYLTSDFPFFGHRLFELHDFVQRQHPNSWRTLLYVTRRLILLLN